MAVRIKKKKLDSKKEKLGTDYILEPEERGITGAGPKTKELKIKLKECCLEKAKYLTGWQRAQADLVNYRVRQEKIGEEEKRAKTAAVLSGFLPFYDSLEKGAVKNKELEPLKKQLEAVFKSFKVERIEVKGKKFDYEKHEAVGRIKSDQESGTILEEAQIGYTLEGKLLRPSKVVVAE